MQINFINSIEDLINMELFMDSIDKKKILYSKFTKLLLIAYYIYMILVYLYTLNQFDWNITLAAYLGVTFLLLTLVVHIFIRFAKNLKRYKYKKAYLIAMKQNPCLFDPVTILASQSMLIISKNNSERIIAYHEIHKVIENYNSIYILDKSSKVILIIPNNAFKTSTEKFNFINILQPN